MHPSHFSNAKIRPPGPGSPSLGPNGPFDSVPSSNTPPSGQMMWPPVSDPNNAHANHLSGRPPFNSQFPAATQAPIPPGQPGPPGPSLTNYRPPGPQMYGSGPDGPPFQGPSASVPRFSSPLSSGPCPPGPSLPPPPSTSAHMQPISKANDPRMSAPAPLPPPSSSASGLADSFDYSPPVSQALGDMNSHPPSSGAPVGLPRPNPPSNDPSPTPSSGHGGAGGLPLPFNGMAQYTHAIRNEDSKNSSGTGTPTHGSQRSYQPSPVSTPQIDAIEGQFSLLRKGSSSNFAQLPRPSSSSNFATMPPAPAGLPGGPANPTSSGTSLPSIPSPPTSVQGGNSIFPPAPPSQGSAFHPPNPSTAAPPRGPPMAPPTGPMAPPVQRYEATQGLPPSAPSGAFFPPQMPAPAMTGPPRPPGPHGPSAPMSHPYQTAPPPPPGTRQPAPSGFAAPPMAPGVKGTAPLPPPGPHRPQPMKAGGPEAMAPRQPGMPNHHPPMPQPGMNTVGGLSSSFNRMQLGPNRVVNLLQERELIPPDGLETPKPHFGNEHRDQVTNCSPDIMRLTLNAMPHSANLLNKARLPLGIHLHPFRDLSTIPVIQATVIVRCKSCRTYINPFVVFIDQRRWRCNICFRQNEVPNEFQFDPVSRQYGDPQRRPEVRSATVEFIAPAEYMLRPPQPAVYLFVLDVSRAALSTRYLPLFCHTLLDCLGKLPGDARTHIGLLTFDSGLHFYKLDEERGPRMLLVNDIEDVFLPDHAGLIVNLDQHRETVEDLLNNLPNSFPTESGVEGNCLGAALQAALKLVGPTGGRVTVVNTALPTKGPGSLKPREDPNQRAAVKTIAHLGPATDFYKSLALECAGQQVAVDQLLLTNAYTDFATILGISRHSGGNARFYPGFSDENTLEMWRFRTDLKRYLTRKIGFEAVMRVRCTRGLAITAFFGNFFVRSTDLLSLPNVSPDAGYSLQMKVEESLSDLASVSFQAALLYTSSKGERRIRVHTLSVPVTGHLEEVFRQADHFAVAGLLAKMAADRSTESGIKEAREALVNAVLDVLKSYGDACLSAAQRLGSLALPYNLRLLPLFVLSILKSRAYRLGVSTRLDDRVAAMELLKTLPPTYLASYLYTHVYAAHALVGEAGEERPPQIHCSAQFTDRTGAYLVDSGEYLFLNVGENVSRQFLEEVFGVSDYSRLNDGIMELPPLETPASERLRAFVDSLRDDRPLGLGFAVVRADSKLRSRVIELMFEDRTEQLMSYQEFLGYLQNHVKYAS